MFSCTILRQVQDDTGLLFIDSKVILDKFVEQRDEALIELNGSYRCRSLHELLRENADAGADLDNMVAWLDVCRLEDDLENSLIP
jgi:hypothetical protein